MAKVIFDDGAVQVPAWVVDLPSFRRWWESDEFPEEGRVCFINGEVWADMSRQQAFSHIRVRDILTRVVGALVDQQQSGEYFGDGLRLTHADAGVSNIPDGIFISTASFRSHRVFWLKTREGSYTELEGSPDLVIEVVSDSSEDKDTDWLMGAYWNAGIREYWLIDARGEAVKFDIFKQGPKGYMPTRKSAGWLKSAVLGKAFRFSTTRNALGHPDYVLQVR